jgi:hypothetical protein
MRGFARRLPWIDGCAGLTVGVLMLALRDLLPGFYGLPPGVVTFIAVANVAYSFFGLGLGALRSRPPALLYWLIFANFMWSVVCVVLAARVWSTASFFGLAHIVLEGLVVALLGSLETRYRREILEARPQRQPA